MPQPPESLPVQTQLDGMHLELRAPTSARVDLGALVGMWMGLQLLWVTSALAFMHWAGVLLLVANLLAATACLVHLVNRIGRFTGVDVQITERAFRWRWQKLGGLSTSWSELPLHAVEPFVEDYHLWVRDTRDGTTHKIGEQTAEVLRWLDHHLDIEAAHAPLPMDERDIPEAVRRMRGKLPDR